jgi:thiamine-phosphate pyrophosphorylase
MAPPEAVPQTLQRIVDANLNRAAEGLRVLEDIARFTLNDAALSQRLKIVRHELIPTDAALNTRLISARDSDSDVGANTLAPGQEEAKELVLVVVANSRRRLYSIERELVGRVTRQDKAKLVTGLHAIVDTDALCGRSHLKIAGQVISGGARAIQLRDKTTSKRELLPIAQSLRELCARHNVLFIMNDYLDLALATDADGLHLGQTDLPIRVARLLLPIDKIIGGSSHTLEEALAAEADGADYVAFGSVFPSPTKAAAVVVGLERLKEIRERVKVPLVAIGGINKDNVASVMGAGADSVAIIGALLSAPSPEAAAREITGRIGGQS